MHGQPGGAARDQTGAGRPQRRNAPSFGKGDHRCRRDIIHIVADVVNRERMLFVAQEAVSRFGHFDTWSGMRGKRFTATHPREGER